MDSTRNPARRAGRFLFSLAILAGAIPAGIAVNAPAACAKEPGGRAGVVVKYSEGEEESHCIALGVPGENAEQISGVEALKKTGLEVVTKVDPQYGEQVCKIEDVGSDDCSSRDYWGYWHASADGSWTSSEVGASTYQVTDGAVEGWVWTGADEPFPPTNQPKAAPFDEICSEATVTEQQATLDRDSKPEESSSAAPWIFVGVIAAVVLIAAVIIFRRVSSGAD